MTPQVNTIFRKIPNFPGYTATNTGKIYGKTGNILIGSKDAHGSTYIVLVGTDKKRYRRLKARLVLEAFGFPKKKRHVIHFKDGNKANCRIENLEWRKQKRLSHEECMKRLVRRIVREELDARESN
jgi:hypothetical protein